MSDKNLKDTLLLPKTNFQIKVKQEYNEQIIELWEDKQIYNKSLLKNIDNNKLIVHDGPPYSNGSIHLGHVVNRILKDIVLRFHSSLGFQTPFILGWDTHGLPIEFKVLNDNKGINEDEIRDACRKYALSQIEIQKNQLKKLGLFSDYNKYYTTQDNKYESVELRVLADLVRSGAVYRGLRPIYWSWSHKTALAENEVEYFDREDNSTFFKIRLANQFMGNGNVSLLIWTTQPWTIPANMLVAIRSTSRYALVSSKSELIIVSETFLGSLEKVLGNHDFIVKEVFLGEQLIGQHYVHPYHDKANIYSIVEGSDIVSDTEGTGILHASPACGLEDFLLAKKHKLNVDEILDESGCFRDDFKVPQLVGVFYQKANQWIIDDLKSKGVIIKSEKFVHSYPHDWRDKSPLVYRLTKQWFIDLREVREDILRNIEKVDWVPSYSKEKMISFINNRDDWCISRQRRWGVPIPAIKIKEDFLLIPEVIDFVAGIVEQVGSDFWFNDDVKSILQNKFPHLLDQDFEIGTDTLDVWFDSGVSSLCVLEDDGNWPADVYLEGKDQFRGWFNSSLIISTFLKKKPPYKKVVSHGFTVDSAGRKMSKSLGNVIDPLQVINSYGIDALRMWVASADFTKETKVSNEILKSTSDNYQKLRNTLRFIVGNISSFEQAINSESDLDRELSEVDYYVLSQAWQMVLDSKENYLDYKFSTVYNLINNFCVNNLSSFYFEIIKDSLYCDSLESVRRKQIVITLYYLLNWMLKIISPITPFLAEEIYQSMKNSCKNFFSLESVHLMDYPDSPINTKGDLTLRKIASGFDKFLIPLRRDIFRELEKARNDKLIDTNSQAKVIVSIDKDYVDQVNFLKNINDLKGLLLVSEVEVIELDNNGNSNFRIIVEKTVNDKCQRCWKFEKLLNGSFCDRCCSIINFS